MATKSQVEKFIKEVAPIAIEQAKKHKGQLFPSVTIAQAAHESGWGTSAKMVKANALYGVKVGKSAYKYGTAWKGKAYKTGTTEYYDGKNPTKIVDYFRAYDNLSDATEDYMDLLCHAQRYKAALNRSTPQESIEGIVAGNYATGPDYAKRIMDTIRSHNLTQYDTGEDSAGNPYTLNKRVVKYGDKGESVKWLQWWLNKHGANLTIDGIFGKQTKLSVLLFQGEHGLVADGIVGPKTIAALQN